MDDLRDQLMQLMANTVLSQDVVDLGYEIGKAIAITKNAAEVKTNWEKFFVELRNGFEENK